MSLRVSQHPWSTPAFMRVAINRSIVYVGLALFITTLYLAIVLLTGALIGPRSQTNIALSVAAVAVVAIAFQPLREQLQRLANRLVFGERATRYEVMVDLSRRMSSALAADEVLPRAAEAAARSVGARSCQAELYLSNGERRRAQWPPGSTANSSESAFAVLDGGEKIGAIWVAMPHGESPGRAALISDIAIQAAPAFRNVRLTADLHTRLQQVSVRAHEILASRQRLVAAEEAARVRFQQEIQRGPERQLELMLDGLAAAKAQLDDDHNAVGQQLTGLAIGVSRTLDDLRELARDVFPTLLADHGVVPALRDQIRKLGLSADVRVDESLSIRRFEPDVEVALYFCGAAALHDARPQGREKPIVLGFELRDGWLRLTLPSPTAATLEDMRDRVASLDGKIELASTASLVVAVPMNAVGDGVALTSC
jgi:signal transduction histidine kinase